MVRSLSNGDAALLVAARGERPFATVDDLWRRANISAASLDHLADADAFRTSLNLARREALWAIKALRDEPLPLFAAAAARAAEVIPEAVEPAVALRAMKEGGEVVEDYGHVGLSLRRHPMSFLRDDLATRRIVPCQALNDTRDGTRLEAAGLVLVQQMPGSAKGVMFITIEDETGIANLVVWPDLFERQRREILGSNMMAVKGYVQCEGDVIHLIAKKVTDLSSLLASLGERDGTFTLPAGRGDEARHAGGGPDSRSARARPRNIYDPHGHIDELKLRSRDFR